MQAALTCSLAITGRFEWLAILANLSTLVLYGACCVAAFVLRRRGVSQGGTPFRIPGGGVLPWLACAVIAWMLTSIRAAEWLALALVLLGASALYLRASRSGAIRAPVNA